MGSIGDYDLKCIRNLLIEGFSEGELRNLCFYQEEFRPLHAYLAQRSSRIDIVDQIIEYIEQRRLHGVLLTWAIARNPAAYKEYGPYLATASDASSGPIGGKDDGLLGGAPQTVLNTGKAWAVLVGVNQYENQPHIPSLHVCVDDVTAVHAALSGKYTAIRLLTDNTLEHLPTRANILGELSSVAQAAGEGDLLLFYFSGHGISEGGESYLLPRDARLAALKHTAIAMKDVREILGVSPARAKVIVLDACHSGAAIGKVGPAMTLEFIQRVFTEAEGMAVLASCKQGQQSWEWPEQGRSVFTHFLLEALSGKADFDGKGLVTVLDASRYMTDGVKAWGIDHDMPQTPTLEYTVAGDIVLLKV